jgi:muconolactone delta-isomerase
MNEYMVTITFPADIDDEFIALIPRQRAMVNELMGKGIMTSYSLSADRQTLWVTMMGASEEQALATLEQMPLFRFMAVEMRALMFHQSPVFAEPRFSLN